MIQSKSKAGFCVDAMDAGEKLLCLDCAIERLAWGEAIIAAVAQLLPVLLAKVSEQRHPPAVACLRVMNHLLKLRPRDSRFAFALFVDEMELLGHIACTEQQHAFAWQSVATGAPCLLIITLQIFRQIVVHHVADVWLVYDTSQSD